MRGQTLALLTAAVIAAPAVGVARADGVFSGRVAVTGFFYTESDGVKADDDPTRKFATTNMMAFGDVRLTMNALRMAKGRIDFRFDGRVRLTGDYDFERKFSTDPKVTDPVENQLGLPLGISSRGYLGGREYDLRELSLLIRATERFHIQIGRMFVTEADNLKLDGLRFIRLFGQHWNGSLFGGLYSNPYSRSVLSDYATPCGQGVSGSPTTQATTPCDSGGFAFGVAAGLGAKYAYDRLWGNFGVTGSFFFGPGDGGTVASDPTAVIPANGGTVNNLLAPDGSLDKPRVFVSWMNSWRPAERVDLLSDIVIDLYGSAGPQPTRAVLLSTIRLIRDDRLTLRLGYSHMSSMAINMYVSRLLYNRLSGTTLAQQGVSAVENNLTVLRTGRDEGRVTLDSRIYRKLGAFIEGRIRDRFLINGASNPSVYQDPTVYGNNTQNLAGDVSGGLRDTGSLKGIRGSLTYTGIFDFRATNHVINFDIGRDFANDRFGFTVAYALAITKDKTPAGVMAGMCNAQDPFSSCFGFRSGMTHEAGLTLTASPVRALFFLLDYRFIALVTNLENVGGTQTNFPTVLSHAILFRTEYRW
jgi:hypothetical protein